MKSKWNTSDIPELGGKVAVVTGATSGIGYEIALQLAKHGAHVVLAARDPGRTDQAARRIEAVVPGTSVESRALDLADLASVRRFADEFSKRHDGLDILINNAGVAGGPHRLTRDGYEAHFQVNHLGHFALTGLLIPRLRSRAGSRVVTMSSGIASSAKIDFDDLQCQRKYGFIAAYAQSKLANLLFAFELDRRCQEALLGVRSFAANPGVAKTNIFAGKEADWGRRPTGAERLFLFVQGLLGLPAEKGALPALYQATDPAARPNQYIVGTAWPKHGYPSIGKIPRAALDPATAKRLWEISENLSGVHYSLSEKGIERESSRDNSYGV